jgi:prepilin-type N-terminal cleavage/methylation domain-containing protein
MFQSSTLKRCLFMPFFKQSNNQTVKRLAFKGFTLSELLVSLGVLGLIAGLTVPSIIVGVERSKNRNLQKESVQVISQIIQEGFLSGDFANISNWDGLDSASPIVQYFTNKLNARQCPRVEKTYPCDHNSNNLGVNAPHNDHSGRWVLSNGTKLQFIDPPAYVNATMLLFTIDSKPEGISKFAVVDGDQLHVVCNISEDPTNVNNVLFGRPTKAGMCGPWGGGWLTQWDALFS